MNSKTISGHYDAVYSLEHNNRIFTPKNVDPARTYLNYNCVMAGEEVFLDFEKPKHSLEVWKRYKDLSSAYWENRTLAELLASDHYWEQMQYLRRCTYQLCHIPHNEVAAFVYLLLLPLIIPCGLYLGYQQQKVKEELEQFKEEQWLRDMEFKAEKLSFREAMKECDLERGTQYLQMMDSVMKTTAAFAENQLVMAQELSFEPEPAPRFATLEEIYSKVFEPSFRAFQEKQRPCRRYNGTYLEKIREDQRNSSRKDSGRGKPTCRKTAEAIEIVFGIGDMDNTGYAAALQDAKKSEVLLKDFCDHLLEAPNVCLVTTKELKAPGWQPLFKHGLIILNLTVHCDEATPGVHLTCIPYSRGCKRGPTVQASLGKAMAGMGYPSTWKEVLDENGERVPKRNRRNEIVHNADGSVRYQQEPDKQGIIDWIEDQKRWLQVEMDKRYGWKRERKGSHPRGNLSTPEYRIAREKERSDEIRRVAQEELFGYQNQIFTLTNQLAGSVGRMYKASTEYELILRYLKTCPDAEYEKLLREATDFYAGMARKKGIGALENLNRKIADASQRAKMQNKKAENKKREEKKY